MREIDRIRYIEAVDACQPDFVINKSTQYFSSDHKSVIERV